MTPRDCITHSVQDFPRMKMNCHHLHCCCCRHFDYLGFDLGFDFGSILVVEFAVVVVVAAAAAVELAAAAVVHSMNS